MKKFLTECLCGICLIIFFGCASRVPLLQIEQAATYLQLDEQQKKNIIPKIQQIQQLVDNYNVEKAAFESQPKPKTRKRPAARAKIVDPARQKKEAAQQAKQPAEKAAGGQEAQGAQIKLEDLLRRRSEYESQIDSLVAGIKFYLKPEQLKLFSKIQMPKLKIPGYGIERATK